MKGSSSNRLRERVKGVRANPLANAASKPKAKKGYIDRDYHGYFVEDGALRQFTTCRGVRYVHPQSIVVEKRLTTTHGGVSREQVQERPAPQVREPVPDAAQARARRGQALPDASIPEDPTLCCNHRATREESIMTKGVHRIPAGSKRARQMVHAKGAVQRDTLPALSPEQRNWNAQVEAKRKAKGKS